MVDINPNAKDTVNKLVNDRINLIPLKNISYNIFKNKRPLTEILTNTISENITQLNNDILAQNKGVDQLDGSARHHRISNTASTIVKQIKNVKLTESEKMEANRKLEAAEENDKERKHAKLGDINTLPESGKKAIADALERVLKLQLGGTKNKPLLKQKDGKYLIDSAHLSVIKQNPQNLMGFSHEGKSTLAETIKHELTVHALVGQTIQEIIDKPTTEGRDEKQWESNRDIIHQILSETLKEKGLDFGRNSPTIKEQEILIHNIIDSPGAIARFNTDTAKANLKGYFSDNIQQAKNTINELAKESAIAIELPPNAHLAQAASSPKSIHPDAIGHSTTSPASISSEKNISKSASRY